MLLSINWMGFYLYGKLACQRKDPVKTARRLEWGQREEVVRKPVAPRKTTIYEIPIEMIRQTFFPPFKGKAPSNHGS